MTDEMMRLLDAVAKGYECADQWVRRYDSLFADYDTMRKQYEENRAHKAFHDAQASANITRLQERVKILEDENLDLRDKANKLDIELRQTKVQMGMRIFDGVDT